MRYRDFRQLEAYMKRPLDALSYGELNHYDNLCRCLCFEIGCQIQNHRDLALLKALYIMNIDRFDPHNRN